MLFVGLTRVGEFHKTCCFVTPSCLEFICPGRPVDITDEFYIMYILFSPSCFIQGCAGVSCPPLWFSLPGEEGVGADARWT